MMIDPWLCAGVAFLAFCFGFFLGCVANAQPDPNERRMNDEEMALRNGCGLYGVLGAAGRAGLPIRAAGEDDQADEWYAEKQRADTD